MEYTQ